MIRAREMVLKQERSVPVQGRVDVMVLADMALYLMGKGYQIGTMSALISHIVELAHYAVESNGLMKGRHESLEDAYQNLVALGLYKGRFAERGLKKLNMSRGFENMRLEGDDPEQLASQYYKGMHNQHSFSPPEIANPVVPGTNVRESIYERNKEYIEKALQEKVEEESKNTCIDPTIGAKEAYPDLVIRVPSKEEMEEMRVRQKERAMQIERQIQANKDKALIEKARERKLKSEAKSGKYDEDDIKPMSDEEYNEWKARKAREFREQQEALDNTLPKATA